MNNWNELQLQFTIQINELGFWQIIIILNFNKKRNHQNDSCIELEIQVWFY